MLENLQIEYHNINKKLAGLPANVLKEIESKNQHILEAVDRVRLAHLAKDDPAKEIIDKLFEKAEKTPLQAIDDLAKFIEGEKLNKKKKKNRTLLILKLKTIVKNLLLLSCTNIKKYHKKSILI